MRQYLIKTPWIIKRLFNSYTWRMPANERAVYLTFDDGPHPEITPWVLEELAKYNALATFFCIGKNIVKHPDTYKRILNENHSVGNHSYNHNNGW
ncbi:MAG TPA: polysaccharide deacetylase family protein, partial [Flavisolibacter sp.]|nr:polysaccharide deacetylase family protein [Flavisolibacter sp.]